MRNYIAPGEKISITATSAITSGQGVLVGGIFGVAEADAAAGQPAVINLCGLYSLPKAPSQAWTVGQVVYWDAANNRATTVATGNTRIGIAVAAVGNGANETTGQVRLNGAAT